MSEERIFDIKSENSIAYDFYSKIDKFATKLAQETGLRIFLVCTNDNYTRLMRVARDANIYIGYSPINHNNTEPDHIVEQAWKSLKLLQSQSRAKAIYEMKSAMSSNKVLTALPDIYQAALNGTGDLLIVCNEFKNPTLSNTITTNSFHWIKSFNNNNIASNIAWEVLSKKGRVFFTEKNELGEIGDIALKIR
jgi:hypothetical protein